MCGICGEYALRGTACRESMEGMIGKLVHRGPDDEGKFYSDDVSLGFRRLSIIDLIGGSQPIYNEDKTFIIIFNGEIYNFKELKRTLGEHHFRTKTDTEVIIHLFEEYGTDSFCMLNGMFALAIYDLKKKILYCARDRFGQKPFNYYFDGHKFKFASEIDSILMHKYVNPSINLEVLGYYFYYNYIPAPQTIYKNIKKLPPQSYIVIDGKSVCVKNYRIGTNRIVHGKMTEEEIIEETSFLLKAAVKRHLIADVDVGVFLSGGLDSTLILEYAQQCNPSVKTFSITFSPYISEEKYISEAASAFGVEKKIKNIEPNIDLMIKAISAYSEPLGDSAIVPVFANAAIASKSLKVVLNGEGGDEVFRGYDRYADLYKKQKRTKEEYLRHISFISVENLKRNYRIMTKELEKHLEELKIDNLNDIVMHEQKQRLPDNLFHKVDIGTMAHGLEARCPMLDHPLVDFLNNLGVKEKMAGGQLKSIVKCILKIHFEDEFINRKKQGFGAPVNGWMQIKDLRKDMFEVFEEEKWNLNQLVTKRYARFLMMSLGIQGRITRKIYQRFTGRNLTPTYDTWKIFTMLVWLRSRGISL